MPAGSRDEHEIARGIGVDARLIAPALSLVERNGWIEGSAKWRTK
jgi:hypothetical protein